MFTSIDKIGPKTPKGGPEKKKLKKPSGKSITCHTMIENLKNWLFRVWYASKGDSEDKIL